MCVSRRIKVYLTEKGIQQKWLATEIGLDPDKLCQTLNGKRKLEAEELSKIVFALNVSADLFIRPKYPHEQERGKDSD